MKRLVALCGLVFIAAVMVGLLVSQILSSREPQIVGPQTAQAGSTPVVSLVTFEGALSQGSLVYPSTWVVDTFQFQVISETQIITNGLQVQPGVWVRVEAVKDEQQALEARTVALQALPTGEIYDRVSAIDDDAGIWQVGETEVLVSDQTNIHGTAAVGELVYVKGRWSLDGLAAAEADFLTPASQVIYLGKILQQQPDQWLVDDVVVDMSDSPPVTGNPEIGSLVEVYGVETSPRHLRAQSILVSSGITEFQRRTGWLVSIEGDDFPYVWRVNLLEGTGITPVFVAVFENTEIDETVASAGYRSWLDIRADRTATGYYRARRIIVETHPPKQTITGVVDQMPPVGLLGQWRVSGHKVEVLADTAIVGAPHIGSLVTVVGVPDYSNKLTAESIEVLGE